MSYVDRFLGKPPFCTCPEMTWDMAAPAPDLQACRDRSPFGFDPHPVTTLSEIMEGPTWPCASPAC